MVLYFLLSSAVLSNFLSIEVMALIIPINIAPCLSKSLQCLHNGSRSVSKWVYLRNNVVSCRFYGYLRDDLGEAVENIEELVV